MSFVQKTLRKWSFTAFCTKQLLQIKEEATCDLSATEEVIAEYPKASDLYSSSPGRTGWFLFPILQFGKSLIPPSTSSSLQSINNVRAGLFINIEIALLNQPLSSCLPFHTV